MDEAHMNTQARWNQRYEAGDHPWDTGRPSKHLVELVRDRPIAPCDALELGCGTGTNAIWLARQDFSVTAVDVSSLAIERASRKTAEAGVSVTLSCGHLLDEVFVEKPAMFVFDRGCFHGFDTPDARAQLARNVARQMGDGGLWFSIIASTDAPKRDHGPPQRSALDIVTAVEPWFEILQLKADALDSDSETPPPAWLCLMRKRGSRP